MGVTCDTDEDLVEWDYGRWEGMTTAEIRSVVSDPLWNIWRDDIPPGETPGEQVSEVGHRAARVLGRCLPVLHAGRDCLLVSHGHFLRILTATWLGLPPAAGRLFALDAAAVSRLGFEHEQQVIASWNT